MTTATRHRTLPPITKSQLLAQLNAADAAHRGDGQLTATRFYSTFAAVPHTAEFATEWTNRFGACIAQAGHAVAATVLGGSVALASVPQNDGGRAARCLYSDLPGDVEPSVMYAGPWADARWRNGPHPSGDAIWAARQRNPSASAALDALTASGSWFHQDAVRPLQRTWPAVLSLAGKLFKHGTITRVDVMHELDCDVEDPAQAAQRLSGLRAGRLTL